MKDEAVKPLEGGRTAEPEPRGPVGIASVLPKQARDILVNAAYVARQYEEGSFARRRTIEDAILAVKTRWPHLFRKD